MFGMPPATTGNGGTCPLAWPARTRSPKPRPRGERCQRRGRMPPVRA